MQTHTENHTDTSRRPSGARNVTPQTFAQFALADAQGDIDDAVESLIQTAKSNTSLRGHLINIGARHMIGEEVRRFRSDVRDGKITETIVEAGPTPAKTYRTEPAAAVPGAQAHIAARVAATASTLRNLLVFPLPGNLPLGDARLADIRKARTHFGPQGRDMLATDLFLARIERALGDDVDATVKQSVNNQALNAYWNQSRKEIEAVAA